MSDEIKEAVEAIVKAKVSAALMESQGEATLLESLIDTILNKNEDWRGNRTFLDMVVEDTLKAAVRRGVVSLLKEREEEIQAIIKKKSGYALEKFAATIIDGFKGEDWRAELKVCVERPDYD